MVRQGREFSLFESIDLQSGRIITACKGFATALRSIDYSNVGCKLQIIDTIAQLVIAKCREAQTLPGSRYGGTDICGLKDQREGKRNTGRIKQDCHFVDVFSYNWIQYRVVSFSCS